MNSVNKKRRINNINTIGERIRHLRLKNGLKQEQLAKLLGTVKSNISSIENNNTLPNDEFKTKLADLFGVTIDYLMGRELKEIKEIGENEIVRIPIIGNIKAGLPALAVENIEGYQIVERKHLNVAYEYFYLKVDGDSMNLLIPENSLVLVRKQDTLENGDIGVILVNGFDATIKKYHKEDRIITLSPVSSNTIHKMQIYDCSKMDVRIIGKAIEYHEIKKL